MSDKVYIVSTVRGTIGVNVPQLNFKRTWNKKGMKIPVEREKLDEMQFDPGFEYMLRQGILYIEDMQVKKDLGLEPEDAKEPTNILIFNEKTMEDIMNQPLWRFKELIGKYSVDQCKNLADYVLEKKKFDYEKCSVIKEITGIDVMKTYEFNKAEEERIAKEKEQATKNPPKPGQIQFPFN
ncbi:hypothetical protein IJD44_00695 [bacterium]|nr:hypothetical protein [bacterium]